MPLSGPARRQARKQGKAAPRRAGSRRPGLEPPKPQIWRYRSRSAAETSRLGQVLGQCLQEGDVLALVGDLGTGKTALVRGIAAGLGAPPGDVSSPTFVLVHEYHGRLRLAHADLYRIEAERELPQLGLSDYLDGRHVVAIEWAEKAGRELPDDRLEIMFSHHSPTVRDIILKPTGRGSGVLFSRARKRWAIRSRIANRENGKPHSSTRSSGLSL